MTENFWTHLVILLTMVVNAIREELARRKQQASLDDLTTQHAKLHQELTGGKA